jgi:hypothetical protein
MKRRMFAKEPGQIRFTEDFHEQTRGSLLPGQSIDLEFADSRIPDESTGLAHLDAWIQFDGGPAEVVPLKLRQGWRDIDPALTERGEGNLWVGNTTPPPGAKEMCIWFVKTGPSERKYYDSRFGKNYWFRFTANDVDVLKATVDDSGFNLEVEAAPEITSVEAMYQILNAGPVSGVLPLVPVVASREGKSGWAGSVSVDPHAVVSFTLSYTAGGRTYTDDNHRRGYLAPDPGPILAARRSQLAPVEG